MKNKIKIQNKSFDKFYERLIEITNFIEYFNIQKKILSDLNGIADGVCDQKILALAKPFSQLKNSLIYYNAVIISSYGCFENYINDLVKEYIFFHLELNREFFMLSESLKAKYLITIADYIKNPNRTQISGVDKERILREMPENMKKELFDPIDIELFMSHGGNLKSKNVFEFFKDIGLKNCKEEIQRNPTFLKYFCEIDNYTVEQIKSQFSGTKDFFASLNKLVELRNNVAHAWNSDQRVSLETISNDIFPYLQVFCKCLLEYIQCVIFLELEEKGHIVKFDNIINVYDDHIICINSKESQICVGDNIFFRDTDDNLFITKILSIQQNGIEKSSVLENNIDVGIKVDKKIKNSYAVFYVKGLEN